MNSLNWKLLLILAVVVLAGFASYPPQERINLGLDLRGGAYILMQVETEATLKYEMDGAQTRIGQQLTEKGIRFGSVVATGPRTLEIRGADPARSAEVREVVKTWLGDWNMQGSGDTLVVKMPEARQQQLSVEAVDTTVATIRRRIDGLGVGEQSVAKQGMAGDRILIQLPGVEDPARVKDIIGRTESLDWKEVTYPPSVADPCNSGWRPPATQAELLAQFGGSIPEDTELFPEQYTLGDGSSGTVWWPLKRVSAVRGTDLINAAPTANEWGEAQVSFELSQDAGRRFEAATRKNVGCIMAIVLGSVDDKYVLSAPTIINTIRDQGRITGQYDRQQAEDFALQLRSGAIPTDLKIIEERTVGPSLGRDSIRAGLTAGLAGFVGVLIFLVIYYRLSGINAMIALALNVLLVFGVLGALPFLFSGARATLTLPGIAGLILTVGMAVDSNVLIFERIREELRMGKTVRSAVEQGFGRAFVTILDCNATTLVAAFFLFSYGTGPVKGFAVTLTIGLLVSMFTAVFVSRQLFELILRSKGRRAESLSI